MSLWARFLSLHGVFLGLREDELADDPIRQFAAWYRLARLARCPWPSAWFRWITHTAWAARNPGVNPFPAAIEE